MEHVSEHGDSYGAGKLHLMCKPASVQIQFFNKRMSSTIKLQLFLFCITVIWTAQTRSVLANVEIKLPATLTIGYEGVPDVVAHQPRRSGDEQSLTTHHRRYTGQFLSATWMVGNRGRLQALLGSQSLYSKRNVYATNTVALAYHRLFHIPRLQGQASWSVGFKSNLPNDFQRGSFTRVGSSILSEMRMESPGDLTAYALVKVNRKLSDQTAYSVQIGGGVTRVRYDALAGNASSADGCRYTFSVDSDNAVLTQQQACGQIESYQRHYPTGASIENQFGFSIEKDLEYVSHYWRVSADVRHQLTRRVGVGLTFIYHHHERPQMDERVNLQAGSPRSSSQTLRASAGYALTPKLSLISSASYRVAPFLSELPMLYSTFSYDKFDDRALTFSLALRLRLP